MLPLVALVGRPNVGKSTLFNALTRTRDALVHDQPGVTRDRNYGVCRLAEGRPFVLVDTGGIAGEDEGLAGATARQSRAAAEEADLIMFIVDGREGASTVDDDILRWLRKLSKPTLLVVNKSDGIDLQTALSEFSRYGLGEALPVSSAHRTGIDELMAKTLSLLPAEGVTEILDTDPARVRIAFVGRLRRHEQRHRPLGRPPMGSKTLGYLLAKRLRGRGRNLFHRGTDRRGTTNPTQGQR